MSERTAYQTAFDTLDEWPDFCTRDEWVDACEFEADEWSFSAARRDNLETARYFDAVRLWVIRISSR